MMLRALRWVGRTVLPGVAITVVLLLLLGGAGEWWLRRTVPFKSSSFQEAAVKNGGLLRFVPGSEVRHTDSVSYWVTERVNSIGFLDREPPMTRTPDTCRIVLVGDSLVTAVQVPNASKVQARLETYLPSALGGRPVQVVAVSTFGIGQVNALGYLDEVIAPLAPNLVIMMAADNDFSNNSPVLTGLRYGWHPDHQWRMTLRRDPATRAVALIGPDETTGRHYLFFPPSPQGPHPERMQRHAKAKERSLLYDRLFRLTSRAYPALYDWLTPQWMPDAQVKVRRMEQIREIPIYRDVFAGWRFPDDLFEDHVFHTDPLPPLFAEAEAFTAEAYQRFRDRGRQDGFQVLISADSSLSVLATDLQTQMRSTHGDSALTDDGVLTRPVTVSGRTLVPRGAFHRLTRVAAAVGLPVVDLYEHLQQSGPVARTRIPYDGHWSVTGHDRIAQALASYIGQHPTLCAAPGGAGQ